MVASMTARCPGPVVAKQAWIISPPPLYLIVGMRCLCWYAEFGFLQTCFWPNISTIVSSVQRTLFQKSWGLFRCSFCKPKLCCHVLFREKRLSPAALPNKPYLFSIFLIVLSLTLTESEMYHLGFLAVYLSIGQSDLGMNLATVLNAFHLWIIFFFYWV